MKKYFYVYGLSVNIWTEFLTRESELPELKDLIDVSCTNTWEVAQLSNILTNSGFQQKA